MKIGFTGTREGLTPRQYNALILLMRELNADEFHHGDCVGADDEAAIIAERECGIIEIICHPPIDESLRAFNQNYSHIWESKSHFARNRDIVDETDVLIGCPPYATPITKETRGGTAYTVNYARKKGKAVFIVRPNGDVEREEAK